MLSPTTTQCKLVKWHVKEGMELPSYSLICDLETETLTKNQSLSASETNDLSSSSSSSSQLELEIQEECYILKLLCSEGEILSVGSPLAILGEDSSEPIPAQFSLKEIESIGDVYNQSQYRMAGWQAYVKSKNDPGQCGCS
jgi:hypothetical protein